MVIPIGRPRKLFEWQNEPQPLLLADKTGLVTVVDELDLVARLSIERSHVPAWTYVQRRRKSTRRAREARRTGKRGYLLGDHLDGRIKHTE